MTSEFFSLSRAIQFEAHADLVAVESTPRDKNSFTIRRFAQCLVRVKKSFEVERRLAEKFHLRRGGICHLD
jgi:hypothetical protein